MNTTTLREMVEDLAEVNRSIGGGRTAKMAQWMKDTETILDAIVTVLDRFAEEVSVYGLPTSTPEPEVPREYDVRDMPGGNVQVVEPLPIIDEAQAKAEAKAERTESISPKVVKGGPIEALLNNFEIDDGIEEMPAS